MSTGDDRGHPEERNGKFCITVDSDTETAGWLKVLAVNRAGNFAAVGHILV